MDNEFKEKIKNDARNQIRELNLNYKLEEINKNIRMLISATTHSSIQETLNNLGKHFQSKQKDLLKDFIQMVLIFFSILLGIAIARGYYFITGLLFGIIIALFILRWINLNYEREQWIRDPNYHLLQKIQKESMDQMNRIG